MVGNESIFLVTDMICWILLDSIFVNHNRMKWMIFGTNPPSPSSCFIVKIQTWALFHKTSHQQQLSDIFNKLLLNGQSNATISVAYNNYGNL